MFSTSFYWLRQPLVSIERLLASLATDNIADLLRDKQILDAIQIASPGFAGQLEKETPFSPKISETLLKYMLRMGTRATPFGLFAGGTVGRIGESTRFDFSTRRPVATHRLDMSTLLRVAHALADDPALQRELRYHANQTVHRTGSRLRYTESNWQGDHWQFFASEVPAEPVILDVLARARTGQTISELARSIAGDQPLPLAEQFIEQLIDDGLLVSELLPAPLGADPLQHLIQQLGTRLPASPLLAILQQVQWLLTEPGQTGSPARRISDVLSQQVSPLSGIGPVLQTDTRFTGGSNQISTLVLEQIKRTLQPLYTLNRFTPESGDLSTFKTSFYARYEEQEIPLLLALDEDTGVGYGERSGPTGSVQELIGDLLLPTETASDEPFDADELHVLRLRLYTDWLRKQQVVAEITDQDLSSLGEPTTRVPESYYAFGFLLASSATAIDQGNYQFALKALSGPSAFTLMGRYCTSDSELHELVRTHLAELDARHPDYLYAEVAHLAQARTGNVVQRPHLSAYEIPYLVPSTLPADQQLRLDDLMVSVPNGRRVVLRSKRLDKEVKPRLTSAHNYRNGFPIYRFLGDLQQQETPFAVRWHWGALAQARRLPRVVYRNVILVEETWWLTRSDIVTEQSATQNVRRLRASDGLPRLIALREGDQELFLDLESGACCQLFVDTLLRLERVQVVEWLQTPDQYPVMGPDGRSTHELVIPFGGSAPTNEPPQPRTTPDHSLPRVFGPGSEWVYLKVYCGLASAPLLLREVCDVARQAVQDGRASHWFFVRYNDPDPHLRVRIHLQSRGVYTSVLAACHDRLHPYLTAGTVHSVQTDTYRRELERYGQELIVETEQIFWRDSDMADALLQVPRSETERFEAGLRSVDGYLTDFGLSIPRRASLTEQLYTGLLREHGAIKDCQPVLAQKYRQNQQLVMESILSDSSRETTDIGSAVRLRRDAVREPITRILTGYRNKDADQLTSHIVGLTHMSVNRLFDANQRTYELMIYHHLLRAYQSVVARSRPLN